MAHFFDAMRSGVKAGVKAFKEGASPAEFAIAGRAVKCPHCGERAFARGTALLNSRGRTLFGLDWVDPVATILVCAECSRIEWFAQEPEEIAVAGTEEKP